MRVFVAPPLGELGPRVGGRVGHGGSAVATLIEKAR
jgi:hypothetical protein